MIAAQFEGGKNAGTRTACRSYAEFLVGRIRQGADHQELVPRIAALIDRAFQCGAEELGPAFDLVKEEPAVRAVLEKQKGGAVLTYRILYDDAQRQEAARLADEVVRCLNRRLEIRGVKERAITLRENEIMTVRLPGVGREEMEKYKGLVAECARPGTRLEFRGVATREDHELWSKNPDRLPEGCEPVAHSESLGEEYGYLKGPKILLRRTPIVGSNDVQDAEVQPLPSERTDRSFNVNVHLTKEGLDKLKAVAVFLRDGKPPGLVAVVLNGQIVSFLQTRGPELGEKHEIIGPYTRSEAEKLVTDLKFGALPVQFGRPGAPGEPIEEKFVEPGK